MNRRTFLKAAGSSIALSHAVSVSAGPSSTEGSPIETSRSREASIQVRDGILYIDTPTQTAMEKIPTRRANRRRGVHSQSMRPVRSQPGYRGGETVSVDESSASPRHMLCPTIAEWSPQLGCGRR